MGKTLEPIYLNQQVIIQAIPGLTTAYVSNEYTDSLKARIELAEKTSANYAMAMTRARSNAEYRRSHGLRRLALKRIIELTALLAFINECIALKTDDELNNNNRYCNIPGDTKPREWRVVFPMHRDEWGWRKYLVRNVRDCDQFRVVSQNKLSNLY